MANTGCQRIVGIRRAHWRDVRVMLGELKINHYGGYPKFVSFDELRRTQNTLDQSQLFHYIGKGRWNPPTVVKIGSRYLIYNGHHRTVAAQCCGRKKLKVLVIANDVHDRINREE